jgi:DEAD/DEAH box helicase domain-containing protein
VQHPDYLLGRSPEEARIDPDNPYILADHLKCASFELAFSDREPFGKVPPPQTAALLNVMAEARLLHKVNERFVWSHDSFPASNVSLRNIPGENFVVIERQTERVLAEVDFVSAHTMLHEGAIHNVDGVQYHVKELDYKGHKAYVEQAVTDFFTDAETYVEVRILDRADARETSALTLAHGDVSVTEKVIGFKKVRFHTSENVGYGEVALPELTMHTMGCWATVAPEVLSRLPYDHVAIADGFVAAARALHFVAALKLMCAASDLGHCLGDRSARWFSVSELSSPGRYAFSAQPGVEDFSPTLFLFDRRAGGVGLAPRIFQAFPELVRRARELVADCRCGTGCPACVGPTLAPDRNPKQIALDLLGLLEAHGA